MAVKDRRKVDNVQDISLQDSVAKMQYQFIMGFEIRISSYTYV